MFAWRANISKSTLRHSMSQYNDDDFDESGTRKDCSTVFCAIFSASALFMLFWSAVFFVHFLCSD